MKKTQIGIIGPNKNLCSNELYQFGYKLGNKLSYLKNSIICGGKGGFMEAVCKGIKQNKLSFYGQTIGILPETEKKHANNYIDIIIPTGMGIARNIIIINASDIIVAAGGGSGTLSELAFAWQQRKTVLCIEHFEGWTKTLARKQVDERAENLFIPVNSIDKIMLNLNQNLK